MDITLNEFNALMDALERGEVRVAQKENGVWKVNREVKEKILAAKRAGIKEIILCKDNRKDIEEINALYLNGLTFHYVNTIKEVLDLALLPEKVKDAIEL